MVWGQWWRCKWILQAPYLEPAVDVINVVCWCASREKTPSLVAHQGNVAGVVENLMDESHVATQE